MPTVIGATAGSAVAILAGAAPAGAHAGGAAHGLLDGLSHPVLGTDHLLAIVAVGVLATLAARHLSAWAIPAGFLVGMLAGGILGIAGLRLPGVELLIACSVVVAGSAIVVAGRSRGVGSAASWRRVAPWLPVLAALAGIAHGQAHGAEIPSGAVPVAYVVGFLVVTAGLHLCGAAAGLLMRRNDRAGAAVGTAVAVAGGAMLLAG